MAGSGVRASREECEQFLFEAPASTAGRRRVAMVD